MLNRYLDTNLTELKDQHLHRSLRTIDGPQGREVKVDGRLLLNFCSNNYLGLASDPRLVGAANQSLATEGFGTGASRLVCGNLRSHTELERKISAFKGTQAALIYSSGYMANVGIISSVFGRGDVIFSDRLNHASIIDGILLSRAEFKRYPHCDMAALERMLIDITESGHTGRRMIITDTVFSMDGDIAPLDEIVRLAKKYGCLVMVDEAHGLGVLGATGKGAVEYFGLEGQIDIQMGTFSKAVGSFGAYCCGSAKLIDFLINHSRSFIYTTGMPPSIAAASLQGLEIIVQEPLLRHSVMTKSQEVRTRLTQLGFDTLNSQTPIIPLIVKDSQVCVEFSRRLLEAGILVSAIRPPTVPQNTARLRMTVMATHTQEDLDQLIAACEMIGRELCLIS